jgi:hypothetical protein
MKSGNLNFLEPSGPLQACTGTALPLPSYCTLSMSNVHRFFVETLATYHNRVHHAVKQALKMLGLIRYITDPTILLLTVLLLCIVPLRRRNLNLPLS